MVETQSILGSKIVCKILGIQIFFLFLFFVNISSKQENLGNKELNP